MWLSGGGRKKGYGRKETKRYLQKHTAEQKQNCRMQHSPGADAKRENGKKNYNM